MAKHRHKRETNARVILRDLGAMVPRPVLLAAPLATMVTASAVGLGMASQEPAEQANLLAGVSVQADIQRVLEREPVITRSQSGSQAAVAGRSQQRDQRGAKQAQREQRERQQERRQARREARAEREATQQAIAAADTHRWATADLNLWIGPGADAERAGVLESGTKVLVTGRSQAGREEIVWKGESRWVTAGYLDDEKPVPALGGACTNGSSVPGNLSPSIIKVHGAVCASFPEITSYGTWRSDGEHGQGRAVDVMVSGDRGWQVAEYLRKNYAALGIEYLIYAQKIWSVDRGGEGWRSMSDRGSATANHYDHVHVTVY